MKRLTLEERGEIAFKLKLHILTDNDPQLVKIEYAKTPPDRELAGALAFEWLLDEFRPAFQEGAEKLTSFITDCVQCSLSYHDEPAQQSPNKTVRCVTTVVINRGIEDGLFKSEAAKMAAKLKQTDGRFVSREELEGLYYELYSELMAEVVRTVL